MLRFRLCLCLCLILLGIIPTRADVSQLIMELYSLQHKHGRTWLARTYLGPCGVEENEIIPKVGHHYRLFLRYDFSDLKLVFVWPPTPPSRSDFAMSFECKRSDCISSKTIGSPYGDNSPGFSNSWPGGVDFSFDTEDAHRVMTIIKEIVSTCGTGVALRRGSMGFP